MPLATHFVEHGGFDNADRWKDLAHQGAVQLSPGKLLHGGVQAVWGLRVQPQLTSRGKCCSFLDVFAPGGKTLANDATVDQLGSSDQRWQILAEKAASARKAAACAATVAAAAAAVAALSGHGSAPEHAPNLQHDALLNKATAEATAASRTLCSKWAVELDGDAASADQWETCPPPYQFPEAAESSLGGWVGLEQVATFDRPGLLGQADVFRLLGALPTNIVAEVLSHVKRSAAYDIDEDTVDGRPTFEYYPCRSGQWSDEGLRGLLETFVDGYLLPYCRARYGRNGCALCDVLVRRYLPGERRGHDVHFDSHAFVTAVLGLSDPAEYEGGLYAQPGPDSNSRYFFPLEPGDLLVHSFNLQHGVHVWKGARYSIVFWIKDSLEAVQNGTEPWHDRLVEQGHADGLYHAAEHVESPSDMPQALAFMERAAFQGHHFAQTNLGPMYYEAHRLGIGGPAALEKSAEHLQRAAFTGFAMAQKNYALAHLHGKKETGIEQDYTQAFVWMRRAAEQLDVQAAFFVGEFYRLGTGVAQDLAAAVLWYSRSADAGFAAAQFVMGMMHLDGSVVQHDVGKARMWLNSAAKQGHKEAMSQLSMFAQV